jgi:hypothetical protein
MPLDPKDAEMVREHVRKRLLEVLRRRDRGRGPDARGNRARLLASVPKRNDRNSSS